MTRQTGTANTPKNIIDEIIDKHKVGCTVAYLAKEYGKPYGTVKSMIKCDNKKERRVKTGVILAGEEDVNRLLQAPEGIIIVSSRQWAASLKRRIYKILGPIRTANPDAFIFI